MVNIFVGFSYPFSFLRQGLSHSVAWTGYGVTRTRYVAQGGPKAEVILLPPRSWDCVPHPAVECHFSIECQLFLIRQNSKRLEPLRTFNNHITKIVYMHKQWQRHREYQSIGIKDAHHELCRSLNLAEMIPEESWRNLTVDLKEEITAEGDILPDQL